MSRSSELKVEKIQTGSGWKKTVRRQKDVTFTGSTLPLGEFKTTMFLLFFFSCYAFSKAGELSTYRMLFFAALSSCVSVRKLE